MTTRRRNESNGTMRRSTPPTSTRPGPGPRSRAATRAPRAGPRPEPPPRPPPQRVERDHAQVDATDQHPPGRRVHQPGEQLSEGRLARAGLADHGHPQPGAESDVDMTQHPRTGG